MPRVVHFEIQADEPERAIAFYSGLFGWKFTAWSGSEYWLIDTGSEGAGINGGLVRRRGPPPVALQSVNAYVCTIGVDGLDETLERAVASGAAIAVPKQAIPGVGWLAYAKDPEGNIFGILQPDQDARRPEEPTP